MGQTVGGLIATLRCLQNISVTGTELLHIHPFLSYDSLLPCNRSLAHLATFHSSQCSLAHHVSFLLSVWLICPFLSFPLAVPNVGNKVMEQSSTVRVEMMTLLNSEHETDIPVAWCDNLCPIYCLVCHYLEQAAVSVINKIYCL